MRNIIMALVALTLVVSVQAQEIDGMYKVHQLSVDSVVNDQFTGMNYFNTSARFTIQGEDLVLLAHGRRYDFFINKTDSYRDTAKEDVTVIVMDAYDHHNVLIPASLLIYDDGDVYLVLVVDTHRFAYRADKIDQLVNR